MTMTITLSTDQVKALEGIATWYDSLKPQIRYCNGGKSSPFNHGRCPTEPHTHASGTAPVYSLGGWAGSGKTTIVKALDAMLGADVVYGTPTHKARGVLAKKLNPHQAPRVRTYHSLVYHMHATYHCATTGKQVTRIVDSCTCNQDDACECPARFDPCKTPADHTCRVMEDLTPERREFLGGHRELIIIDESSMLSIEQVQDVRAFGVPVVLVGDHGQLPPVKAEMNPWIQRPDAQLTEIHRQGADSGVLLAAHDIRRHGGMTKNRYGTGDAVRMALSNEYVDGVFERFIPGPDRLIVTPTNKIRADFNDFSREDGPVREGDRVVALGGRTYDANRVVMNGTTMQVTPEFLQVHNGMTGTVRKTFDKGGPTFDMVVQLDDHALATPGQPVCLLVAGAARAQFGAETDLAFNSKDRPKGSRLWDYAYALTAHKAQGSEFEQVIVIDSRPQDYKRWLYTSVTRAKDKVLVLDYRR